MDDSLIKSKSRVRDFGEIFTPQWVVDDMVNQDGINELASDLRSTFLEPSAGEGVFLVEVLKRKLRIARQKSRTITDYETNSLIALTSIYGIELLEDNVEILVMNINGVFDWNYYDVLHEFGAVVNKDVIKSARTIISSNMVQGNAITKEQSDGKPIIFSEWKMLPVKYGVQKVQRIEYTLEAIMNDGSPLISAKPDDEQLELFSFGSETSSGGQLEFNLNYDNTDIDILKYESVKISEVWQRRLTEVD